MISAAVTTGSMHRSGIEECPPLPRTVIWNLSTLEVSGPGQELIQLGVMDGVQEVYGIHLSSGFPTGCFATRPG